MYTLSINWTLKTGGRHAALLVTSFFFLLLFCLSLPAAQAAQLTHQLVSAGSGAALSGANSHFGIVGPASPAGRSTSAGGMQLYSAGLLMASGIGADSPVDIDGDGIPDSDDAFPNDSGEQYDTDGDGIGNNTDTDDDGDGVSDLAEGGTDGNRDGNGDGIADRLQRNVTSLTAYDSDTYVTMASPEGTTLTYCQATFNPSPDDAPVGIAFELGLYDFTINGLTPGGTTWLKLYLPEGNQPDTYYKYGRTPEDDTDHWYEFLYDGVATGAVIEDNMLTIHFVDALDGDDILTEDSLVIDLGGPGYFTDSGGDGSIGCFIKTLF